MVDNKIYTLFKISPRIPHLYQCLDVHLAQTAVTETQVAQVLVQVVQQLLHAVSQVAGGQVEALQRAQWTQHLVQLVRGIHVTVRVHGVG